MITGSYDFDDAFVEVDGVYTNKPPGGVAYRCSFRVTEAVHAIERMVDILAHELDKDPLSCGWRTSSGEQFPYKTPTGWEYDSGDYGRALQKALDLIGYDELRKEQAEKRDRGELMGIGIGSFTEIVGAGPSHDFDILGLKMFDSCEIQVHRPARSWRASASRRKARDMRRPSPRSSPRSWASRSATSRSYGDTDTAPYGLGTYARSTPVRRGDAVAAQGP